MHVCVVGGGGVLAQHVIRHYCWSLRYEVTSILRPIKTRAMPSRPVDVLVTLVGKEQSVKLDGMAADQWNECIEDNLSYVGKWMADGIHWVKDGGNVVVVGSIVGSTGGYGCAAYAAAKAGLVGLVRAAANELASRRVCVNLLELGYVDCGMGARLDPKVRDRVMPTIPLGRFAEPGEVVGAIDFLARTRYMTGGVLTFAGGLR